MVKVGCDEYCTDCCEWREYNEEGCCKICGKRIKKNPSLKNSYINVDEEYNKKIYGRIVNGEID